MRLVLKARSARSMGNGGCWFGIGKAVLDFFCFLVVWYVVGEPIGGISGDLVGCVW